MPLMLPAQSLLKPVDDASGVEQPPRFAEAPEQGRAVIARCDKAGVPSDTLIAALMLRLVQAYGSNGVGGAQSACSRRSERPFGTHEPAVGHSQTMNRKRHMTERKK